MTGALAVTYHESPKPGEPRQLFPTRVSCMTPLGDAVLDYADQLDQIVLEIGRSTLKWPHCSSLIWPHPGAVAVAV